MIQTSRIHTHAEKKKVRWTLLSNHGHVLLSLYRNPELRLREVALEVGITERAVQKIICELQEAGFLEITKVSRNNIYHINKSAEMRHPLERGKSIGTLLNSLK